MEHPLINEIRTGNIPTVKQLLIMYDINGKYSDHTPLVIAVWENNYHMVSVLFVMLDPLHYYMPSVNQNPSFDY
jgi:hypothetical protein